MALFLSVLGLYGTLSEAARVRRRDLVIRIAPGARRLEVIRQILREGGQLACVGSARRARVAPPVTIVVPNCSGYRIAEGLARGERPRVRPQLLTE